MWKALLPREVTLTLNPRFDSNEQQLYCTYQIDGLPLLEWITRRVVELVGNVNLKQLKVTPDEIIITIPKQDLPYKIADISIGDITIQLKKE